jgi:hypothetical protein
MDADWTINQEDLIKLEGRSTVSDTFTRIYVTYTDASDGSQREAHADAPESGLGLLEEVVHASRPMTSDAAQALADEAASVLGGTPLRRYWVTIDGTQLLQHTTGTKRPAREIVQGDTARVPFQRKDDPLHVFDAREDEEGVVHLALADQDLSTRLDMELRLLLAEEPKA